MKKLLIFTLSIASLTLSGCSLYEPDIQQGNVIQPKQLALLQVGMDKEKVRFIMGTPLLTDPFHPNRWDYVYTMKKPGKPMQEQHVTLIFDGNKLAHIEKHLNPAIKPPELDKSLPTGRAEAGPGRDSDAD